MAFDNEDTKYIKMAVGGVITIIVIIVLLSVLFGSWYNVGEGEVGVMFKKFGTNQGFQPQALQQGYGMKMPFRDRVITIPFRTQTIGFYGGTEQRGTYSAIQPKDKNGINFNVDVTIRYRLDPAQASAFVEQKGEGVAAMETILATAARGDSTRGVFGQYNQEDIPQQRTEIAAEVQRVLQERIDKEGSGKLKPGFITIEAVDIRNVQFDPRIEEAIVNKQTQKQIAEKKVYELQQADMDRQIALVNADKQRNATILIAKGDAEAKLLVATATAKGIQLVNDAYKGMPNQYVAVKFAEAIKPTDKIYLGFDSLGGNSLNLLNMNQLMAATMNTTN